MAKCDDETVTRRAMGSSESYQEEPKMELSNRLLKNLFLTNGLISDISTLIYVTEILFLVIIVLSLF